MNGASDVGLPKSSPSFLLLLLDSYLLLSSPAFSLSLFLLSPFPLGAMLVAAAVLSLFPALILTRAALALAIVPGKLDTILPIPS